MRQKAIVLAVVAFVVVAVAGAFILNRGQTVMAGMSDRLEGELTKALGSSVSVGGMELMALNKVQLYDVSVRDSRGGLIASGPKVTVVYNPFALLGGSAAVEAVTGLSLDEPRITLERRTDGKWNIDELLDKTRSGDSPFKGIITVNRGTVSVAAPEGRWQFDEIAASFDFANKPDIALALSAAYKGSPLELTGHVSRDGASVLAGGVTNLDLDGLGAVLPADMAVKPAGGRLAQAQIILRRDKGQTIFAGEAKLDGANFDVAGVAVKEARGSIAFSDKQVFLFPLAAKVYGQNIEVRGKVATDTAEPVLNLTVSAAGFDPQAVSEDIPLRGPVSFTATLGGTPSRPVIGLNAEVFGGKVSGTGSILLAKKEYNIALYGRNLDLASLPEIGVSVAGRGDIDLRLEGTGSLAAAKYTGSVQANAGQIEGIPFATLSAGFFKTGGILTADYITMGFPGSGVLTASGTADNGRLNMTFFGQGIPLNVLAARTSGLDLTGTADAEGTVGGTTGEPVAKARFTAYNGQALQQPFSLAKGGLTLTRSAVTLDAVEATNGVTRHTVSGSVGLTGARELNLTVATRQARAENLVKLIMPGERLTGNVDNEVAITGPLAAYTATGHVKLSEGSFRGQLIARAEGSYRRQGGTTELRDFMVSSLNAEVRFDGTVGADSRINLNVAAKDIDLAAVHVKFPYPVAGKANFTGQLTGTTAAPVFSGEVASASLKLNGQELTNVSGQMSVDSEQLSVPSFGFSQGEGKFAFAGGVGFAGGTINGDITAQNGSVAGLLAIFNIQAKDVDGRLDGHVTIGGTVARPDIWLTGTLTKGKIKNYPLDNIEADIALSNNVVTINRFDAKQGDGVLAARGTAAIGGPLNLEVSGRAIDAGLLTAWLDATAVTRGKLTFTAQVTGTSYSPHAAVSLEINGGGVANATFDELYGMFILDKGSINVNQAMVTKGPYRASAYGTIPLAALNREGRARGTIADEMDLKVRLEQANLSILPLLSGEVAWAAGETKGELTVGGTLAQPLLRGSVVVHDGTVKLKGLAEPIQKVGVDIQFEGDKINIITFDGSMGGGSYRLTGTASLNGVSLADYRLLLVLDKLGINHKYFKGPLQGTLTLVSTGGKPVLGGSLVFDNTTINVPFVPEFAPSGLDVGLDLEVVAARKVRLMNPYFYDLMVEGKARFRGSSREPAASGRFTAVRGTVNYLRTQFRVDSATADFTQFASFLPVIRLNADTKLEYTTVKLAVNGPLNAMEFHLSSEPSMSQQQILSLLTLRNRYADRQGAGGGSRDTGLGRDELLSLFDAGLQMTFVAEAESAFRNSLGLDEFRFVRSNLTTDASSRPPSGSSSSSLFGSGSSSSSSAADERQLYNVAIGKYITDRLYLSYTFGIDHRETSGYLRYDLNRRFSVTGAIDEYNRRRVGVEARFTF